MAEFNSSAFSAVDSFFVIDKKGVNDNALKFSSTTPVVPARTRRMGVGATKPTTDSSTGAGSKAANRLMQVGSKKRGRVVDDEDEMVQPDDDDEEELGRTGIASEPAITEEIVDASSKSKKKKKKKGKKERQLKKEEEEETTEAEISKEETTDKDDTNTAADTKSKEGKPNEAHNQDQPKHQKRKRRKVRSRQKNIYKDNRAADQKPDHLLPGGYEYKGRPITPATRTKLVTKNILPASEAPASGGDDLREVWDGKVQDSGVPVLSSEATTDMNKTSAEQQGKVAKKNKGTKKKSKYKNL